VKTRWHLTTTRQEKRTLRHLQGQCGNPVIRVRLARLSTAPPPPPVALTCRAHMSDSTPAQYSYDHVIVKTGQPDASVRAVAHDKTTSTPKGGTSGSDAVANLTFYIAGATPG
jgi:hypothetical protein